MAQARSRAARIWIVLGGLAGLAAVVGGVAFYVTFLRDLPDLRDLHDYRPLLTSRVLAADGRLIGEFYDERRFLVPLEEIPEHVVMAFVSAEDDAFFEHTGLDYQAILRAAWVNLAAGGEVRQGGSTITQQLAKTLLLSPERRYTRKVKDMLLARRIEQHFSKQDILYLYLNQIYFGHGAYGIGEAARSYFGILPSELDVSQAALLAGLPKAPSAYSPHRNPEAAERRRQYVLRRMYEVGVMNESGYEEALAAPPELQDPPELEDMRVSAYFVEAVRRALFERLGGETVRRAGLVIETTLDLDAQRAGVKTLQEGLRAIDHRQGYRGPVRRMPAEAVEEALPGLAEENRLVADPDDPEAGVPELPFDEPLLAVVTRVDEKGDRAEVAFAPERRGVVRLRDTRWARTPNPNRYPVPVRSISRIFAVGDVARFVRPTPEEDAAPTTGPPRVLLHQEPEVEGALFSFEIPSGDVLTLVGGYDFERSEFDRVTQARRQPGSAFKPVIYGAALANGYTPVSIIVDRPLVYEDPESGFVWRPGNYKGRFHGPVTLRDALGRSINNATIHLLSEVGVSHALRLSRQLGIESPLERNLALALGTSGVSLFELTRAYAVFPAQGRMVKPRFIRRVLDADGNVLLEDVLLASRVEEGAEEDAGSENGEEAAEEPVEEPLPDDEESEEPDLFRVPPDHVISPVHAYLVTDMLRAVVTDREGTGKKARVLRRPVAGKTGTTNEQGDAWFIGFSPDVAAGVWVGFDETRVLGKRETGGGAALPIWVDYMRDALRERPRRDFAVPEGIVFAKVDPETGLLAAPGQEKTFFQSFALGTVPTETADGSVAASDGDRLLRMDAF